jgi:hypothetical protein
MVNNGKGESYPGQPNPALGSSRIVKLGLITVASAFVGGLAFAWWHRDTLRQFRNPIDSRNLPKTGSFEEFPDADSDAYPDQFDTSEPGVLPHLLQD